MIKEECTDIDVRSGMIRQRNNSEMVIFDIDASDLLQDMDLPLIGVKTKVDLLKMFVGNDEIELATDDERYSIKDEFSKISFVVPNVQFIENKFIEKTQLTQMFEFDDREIVFSHNFSQKVCERMRIIATNYDIDSFMIEFNGDFATMKANTESKDQSAVLVSDIPLDIHIEGKICNIISTLFITEHDSELRLNMYINKSGILFNEANTSMKGINYTIYNRTRLLDEE
jgi:hypothetical protein